MIGGPDDTVNVFERKLHCGEFQETTSADGERIQERVWRRTGACEGVPHKKGDPMMTWQVMQELGLHSYRMDLNPVYHLALQTFMGKVTPIPVMRPPKRSIGASSKVVEVD